MNSNLTALLQALDEKTAAYTVLDQYYEGRQPLAFLSPEAKLALGNRLTRMASNICKLAVTSLAERLRVTGFAGADVWDDWIGNDLDQTSGFAHREALTLGSCFLIVWADAAGRPTVSVESPRQVACLRDPGTRQIVAAVKRWETGNTTEAVLYEADKIIRYRANTAGATIHGFTVVEVIPNPLGVPPIVQLQNGDRILDDGVSEITDLIPLVDGLNKSLADMMVTSEYFARPRRWATGLEMTLDSETGEAENPIPEGNRMMVSEATETKFGQLPAGDLAGYQNSVNVLLSQIMAVSSLPSHYIGVTTDNPASADALRASEASLTARAESRQSSFGRSWEQVARLMVAVRTGADPASVRVRVQWADASTRSVAQESDAITKLHAAGLLPVSYALKRLGYRDDEIDDIRAARRLDSLDAAGKSMSDVIA